MFKIPLLAAVGAAVALVALPAAPALAQSPEGYGVPPQSAPQAQDAVPQEDTNTGRNRRNRNSQPPPPTPEQIAATAQVVARAAGSSCQVTEAVLRGQTPEGAKTYEAACATGPGFILIEATPPQAVDCVLLAGQADIERRRDPAADVGTQCTLPQNLDVVRVVAAYATEAGVTCTVDQGASIGKAASGNLIYEAGCTGTDGYWLEKLADGWKKTECAVIVSQNGTCRFSTTEERAATLKARFASNPDAAACDVTEGRYMGANANGSFYEAKCAAGNGVIVRFDTQFAVQQVYPCETAQRIGGGCTLTVVPPPAEAAAPANR